MSVPARTERPSRAAPSGRGPVEGRTASLGPTGAELVTVEARFEASERGGTRVLLTGLPDGALRESRARLPAVLASAGLSLPQGELHLNLAPATRPKQGGLPDLGIACTVACALGQIPAPRLRDLLLLGEVDLGGAVHPAAGALAATLAARGAGLRTVLAPTASLPLLRRVPGMEILPVTHLRDALDHLRGARSLQAVPPHAPGEDRGVRSGRRGSSSSHAMAEQPTVEDTGLDEVRAQDLGKRALLVTAAGGHSLLLRGSPGVGKSMLAQRLPGLLPRLTPEEQLELLALADADPRRPSLRGDRRPLRAPHHTTSFAGLVGGGRDACPGEVSLAHRGVLFLDELPEFRRDALEALREPLEAGEVRIARAREHVVHPSRVLLVAAMNPCPCGWLGHPRRRCTCTPAARSRYAGRISGPLLDRFDLLVDLAVPEARDLLAPAPSAIPGRPGKPQEQEADALTGLSPSKTRGPAQAASSPQSSPCSPSLSTARAGTTPPRARGQSSAAVDSSSRDESSRGPLTGARITALLRRARELRRARGQAPLNGRLAGSALEASAPLGGRAAQILRRAALECSLSARAVQALRRVARTLADLEGSPQIEPPHMAEALFLHGHRGAPP